MKNKTPYNLKELLNNEIVSCKNYCKEKENIDFNLLCEKIKKYFSSQSIEVDDLERQKKAIIGYSEEVAYYKDKINEFLDKFNYKFCSFPSWYTDLAHAIFHELWGLAGIAQWYEGKSVKLKNSSSAKIIGDKIYYMIDGKTKLMPQKISKDRRKQLRRALLSNDFRVRLDNEVPDIEMVTGERIKIFSEDVTRKSMDTIVFRKFPVKEYTFERQVELKTYPPEAIDMFKELTKIGYNMSFTGAVRSGKTTQLSTWLNYEDKTLEGLIVETRPEIPLDKILKDAPIISLVVDTEEKLSKIRSSIMRSDADYVIMAEARDAYAYDIALKSANVGTRRCKLTSHVNSPLDLPYEFAKEIVRVFGGNIRDEIISIAKTYTLNLHFINLPKDKSQKRLEGIYIFDYDINTHKISINTLCKYNILDDKWTFNYYVSNYMKKVGHEQDYEAFNNFCKILKLLSMYFPMNTEDKKTIYPFYNK